MPHAARACSVCAVGDPTLTLMGQGQPGARRLRLSTTETWRRLRIEGVDMRENRLSVGVAYAPHARLMLAAQLPFAHQRLRYPNLAERRRWSLGDATLDARAVIFRDRAFAPTHLLLARFGVEAPTGSSRDAADLGTGGWSPRLGLAYAHFAAPWSSNFSASVRTPTSNEPISAELEASVQLQPWTAFGFRLGADVRYDGETRVLGYAGLIGRVGDLVLSALVAAPMYQALNGTDRVWPSLRVELTLDV